MKIEPLSLDHQELLESKFLSLDISLSEFSFASRFIYRTEQNIHVLFDGDEVWIRGHLQDGRHYLMPT